MYKITTTQLCFIPSFLKVNEDTKMSKLKINNITYFERHFIKSLAADYRDIRIRYRKRAHEIAFSYF